MEDFNSISITGRLTRDPELKIIGNSSLVTISIASNKRILKDGEWVEQANFIDCKMWGKDEKSQAHRLNEWVKKGQKILVTGKLDIETWDTPEGKKASKAVIQIEKFFPLEKKTDRHDSDKSEPAADEEVPF